MTGNPLIAAAASVVGSIFGSILWKPPHGTAVVNQNGVSVSGSNAQVKSQGGGGGGGGGGGRPGLFFFFFFFFSRAACNPAWLMWLRNSARPSARSTCQSVRSTTSTAFRQPAMLARWIPEECTRTGPRRLRRGRRSSGTAVAFAVKTAIQQGALQGLSDLAQKAVKTLDIDSAVQFVQDWNNVMKDFDSMTDPVAAAVKAITDPLDKMRATMVQVGASTEDLNKIDEYRTKKLDEALKAQLSSVNDFLKVLRGDNSGVSQLNQLNADMAEFNDYKTRIAAGDTSVDQGAFSSLGQDIFNLANSIYGTATSQFQDIRSMLTQTAQQLATNVTTAFNAAAGNTPGTADDTAGNQGSD